jgi:hypothetical protein
MANGEKWHLRGSYFESCNCDPICPCRRIDGVAGGRSTHGDCYGVLTWLIDDGGLGEVALNGLAVALASYYSDDEAGSPWSWILYVDSRATPGQRAALEAIYTGQEGGDAETHFPWAWKPSNLLGVRSVEFEVDHQPRRQFLRIRDFVNVRIRDRFADQGTVTCVIPGHDRDGEELVADELRVDDLLAFSYSEVCGYAASFDYSG